MKLFLQKYLTLQKVIQDNVYRNDLIYIHSYEHNYFLLITHLFSCSFDLYKERKLEI